MHKNKRALLPVLLLSNIFPLVGVLREGWPFFLVLYLFWFEMLIVTGFALLKMFFSRAGESGWEKARIMFSFALARFGIFCFYLIFIVVFIGVMANGSREMIRIFGALGFGDTVFNLALLNFVVYNALEFVFFFMLNDRRRTSKPSDHNTIIDGRQIVVHVVVVLGAFLSNFILGKTGNNYYYSNLALVVLFIAVKSIADIYGNNPEAETPEKYI